MEEGRQGRNREEGEGEMKMVGRKERREEGRETRTRR